MVIAFNFSPVETAESKWNPPVGTKIPDGKRRTLVVATEKDGLAQHGLGHHLPSFERFARNGIVPQFAERLRARGFQLARCPYTQILQRLSAIITRCLAFAKSVS
jgi:hypothetical protein